MNLLKNFSVRASAPSALLFIHLLFWPPDASAQAFPEISLTQVINSGLTNPVQVVNANDGTGRLFIVQQGGTIKVFDRINDEEFTDRDTFFEISGIPGSGEQGLLSMAFDPQFAINKKFYVFYTNSGGDLELASYETGDDPYLADPETGQVLMTIPHPEENNHNGGEMHFGPDGMLYLSVGDGGGGGDPDDNSQNPDSDLGKILRLDVNESELIPDDNPLSDSRVFALGLRNPFRWSFDRETNDVWIGDVGQNQFEEINAVSFAQLSGANFGWRCYEGNAPYNTEGCGPPENYVSPVHAYPTGDVTDRSVIGGIVYRGDAFTDLRGYYIGADYFTTGLLLIRRTEETVEFEPIETTISGIADFGESENGEVYAVSRTTNSLYRVISESSLPVKFVSFKVSEGENNTVILNWETVNSEAFHHYELQKRSAASAFSTIATIPRKDLNGEAANYRYLDTGILPGQIYYYRILITNDDGTLEYSKIASVSTGAGSDGGTQANSGMIRPNIVEAGKLNLMLPEAFDRLELFSVSGQYSRKISLPSKRGEVRVNTGSIPAGLYIARFINSQKIVTEKVIFP